MGDLSQPFGVNIARGCQDPAIAEFVIDESIVTTSPVTHEVHGNTKAAGLTVYHVVPTLQAALKPSMPELTVSSSKAAKVADLRARRRYPP